MTRAEKSHFIFRLVAPSGTREGAVHMPSNLARLARQATIIGAYARATALCASLASVPILLNPIPKQSCDVIWVGFWHDEYVTMTKPWPIEMSLPDRSGQSTVAALLTHHAPSFHPLLISAHLYATQCSGIAPSCPLAFLFS